jgi:hypothetical protein
MNRLFSLVTFVPTITLASLVICNSSWALNSCQIERPSEVVSFSQGAVPTEPPSASSSSDPEVLLRPASDSDSLSLGVGGSITLKFTVPIANYPAAGLLTIERPGDALPCSSHPVRAEVSGSIDGVNFLPLGTTCEGVSLDLGGFPWIAYLRITDITDPSDPAFGSNSINGFDMRSVVGPGCLKYSYCAAPAIPDTTLTGSTLGDALSLSHLGKDFVFAQEASFEEYGNGTARLLATTYRRSDPEVSYTLVASFTGRVPSPPPNTPVLALNTTAYISHGGTIDSGSWYYYKRWNGVLLGNGSHAGDTLKIKESLNPLQLGNGANGRNSFFGASGGFSYASSSLSSATAEMNIDLRTCSTPEPSPTPVVVLPTPTPATVVEHQQPMCESKDLTDKLLGLDNVLFSRLDTLNRATRLLVREHRSQPNLRYRSRIRAEGQNLYLSAWRNVWRHERIIRTCLPSTECFDLHLEPAQATIAASAQTLDTSVENVLLHVGRKLTNRKAKRTLKRLSLIHSDQRSAFASSLSGLPHHASQCRSIPSKSLRN